MQRIFIALAFVVNTALAGFYSDGKSFVWQRIDSTAEARADGSITVTEQLTLRYTNGPFTFAFRDLPRQRLDGISHISVSDDTQSYRQVDDAESTAPHTFSITKENGTQRVRWVYPATTGGARTFTLRYEVAGAVRRYANYDEIWWSFVFPNRDELVEQGVGRIVLPQPVATDRLVADAPGWPGAVERAPGTATVQAANIPANTELALRLQFPKGVVGGVVPAWQVAAERQAAYDTNVRPTVNVVLSALAAGLAVLLSWLVLGWWRRVRDPQARDSAAGEQFAPPDALPPALAARLLGRGYGEAVLATLFDLANRGLLIFREVRHKQLIAVRTEAPAVGLAAFEEATLSACELVTPGSELHLTNDQSRISKAQSELEMLYHTALLEQGYLDPAALERRKRSLIVATIATMIGGGGFTAAVVMATRFSLWLPVVAGVVFFATITWLGIAAALRSITQAGADAMARWHAFRDYLGHMVPQHASSGAFGTLLPYAIALGQAKPLMTTYSATAEVLPVWYYPLIANTTHSGGYTATGNALPLQDFSQNFLSALTSATSSVSIVGASAAGASGGGGGGAG